MRRDVHPSLLLANCCGFNHLHRFSINTQHLATDLHPLPQRTKIGFPGWPEPILDSVTGLGASIMKKGACTGPLFRFWDMSTHASEALFRPQSLTLSFVPDAEQRLWRTVTRKKYQLRCDRIRLQNQVQSLLEEAHIKLSSLVTDLLGVSARRMLKALADGETNPATLAALADQRLRATPEQLCDALGACTELNVVYRRLLKMALEELRLIDEQIGELDKEMASLLSEHQNAVERLAEVPGLGVDSAQQIIAEVGPTAATFPSAKQLSSWVGACPGDEESAGVNYTHRSPKGNRHMRRVLNQTANAAVKTKGSIFEIVYRRSVPRLGHNQAIGAIAHRQCRLIWLILHQAVRYEERGPAVTKQSKQRRTTRMIRQLRSLGYRIELANSQPTNSAATR